MKYSGLDTRIRIIESILFFLVRKHAVLLRLFAYVLKARRASAESSAAGGVVTTTTSDAFPV
jgi:hypothetical protein